MPGLKTRKKTSKPSKKKVTRARKSARTLKAKPATRAKAAKKHAPVRKAKIVIVAHPDQTTVTLGPHHVDHLHPVEGHFHVHPGPTMHPVGPMAMKHPRSVTRHH